MQKSIVSIPGYQVNEYLLVLNPNEELRQQILVIKKEFFEKYGTKLALKWPHITLINFLAYEMREERIINSFGMIGMGIKPFKVELRGFGSFPSHTIYINVATKFPILDLVKDLKQSQRLLTLGKDAKPHFMDESHITICRKLKPWQYEQAWLDYSHRHFSGRFMADSMMLLKKPCTEEGKYKAIMRFEFKGEPMLAKQASLFM